MEIVLIEFVKEPLFLIYASLIVICGYYNVDYCFKMWCPPTPPQEENDVYLDQTMCFLYESQTMSDTQLPPVYVKKELKRVRSADVSPSVEGIKSTTKEIT